MLTNEQSSPRTFPTIPSFIGRGAELAWLQRLWNEAATRDSKGVFGGPRLAILIAETGLGKSRLVQELYQVLTTHPDWNPSDRNYWPNKIVSDTGQIRVNPEFGDPGPRGPPRFLWLGSRWQPIDTRNVEERTCTIPALRDALYVHVSIAQRHRTIWQRLRTSGEKKIRSEGPGYVLDKAIDLSGIPYAGLVLKLIKAGMSARDAHNAPTSMSQAIQKQQEDAAHVLLAEMHEVFGGFGGGGLVLPTVLWLDDAQWIDSLTLRFLHDLWKDATAKRWPLLVIITHTEREWNELRRVAIGESLLGLATQPGAEKWFLAKAPIEEIEAKLNQRLPGLLPAQRASMLEKAAGNFLTLEENVGELIGDPENFVNLRIDGPLTHAGEDLVATWGGKRQTRVHDGFKAMKPKPALQRLLAWASRVGIRFPREIPADFAARREGGSALDNNQLLESCMDPYAVLGKPSPNFLEFRDRAYYAEGTEHFRRHLAQTDETELLAILRDTLTTWINGAFDENGDVHLRADRAIPPLGQKADRFSGFGNEEKRVVLDIALRELPLPSSPDWTDGQHRAALRAILLYLSSAGNDSLWPAVSQCAPRLRGVRWENLPAEVASTKFLVDIGGTLFRAAMVDVAAPLLEEVLARRTQDAQQDPDQADGIVNALTLLGVVYAEKGSFDEAERVMVRAVRLAEQTFGEDALQVASLPLMARARVLSYIGKYGEAEVDLLRAKGIFERILRDPELPPDREEPLKLELLKRECQLGRLYLKTGRAALAEEPFRRLVRMRSRLDPDSLEEAMALNDLAESLSAQKHWDEAERLHLRAIAIMERTLGKEHPDVGSVLTSLANHFQSQGRIPEAIELIMRSNKIVEGSYGPTHFELAKGLTNLAHLYWSQGDKTRATPLADRAIAMMEKSLGPYHPMVAMILSSQAETLRMFGQPKAAEPLFLRAIEIMERCPDPSNQPLGSAYTNLGVLMLSEGRIAEADKSFERAMTFMENPSGPDHSYLAQLLEGRAVLYRLMGENDKEKAALARAQEIRQAVKDRPQAPLSSPVAE